MANIEVQGDKLIITCDLTNKPVLTASGKTYGVDTTHGFVNYSVPGMGTLMISLNVNTRDANFGKTAAKAAAPQPTIVKAARA